jgi:hypothetical protein
MKLLDRRFLNLSLAVQGIANKPADNPTAGIQYIVGSNGTDAFAGVAPNSIARYNGSAWEFMPPKAGELEVLDVSSGQFKSFNGSNWEVLTLSGSSSDSDTSSSVVVVKSVVYYAPNTRKLPADFAGLWLVSDSNKLRRVPGFTYIDRDENHLEASFDVVAGINTGKIYTYDSETGVYSPSAILHGQIVFSILDNSFYSLGDNSLVLLGRAANILPVDYVVDYFDNSSAYGEEYFAFIQSSGLQETIADGGHGLAFTCGETGWRLNSYSTEFENYQDSTANLPVGSRVAFRFNFYEGSDSVSYKPNADYNGVTYGGIVTITGNNPGDISILNLIDGDTFLSKHDNSLYLYRESDKSFSKIAVQGSSSGGSSGETFTEAHSLTAAEATAKAFSLTHNIAAGSENSVICFVSGIAQIPGTDFTASGSSISWNNKGLDAIGLEAGDTFLLYYAKE